MTKPIVSVVMPVYNTAKYVQAAIDSVLTQTFRNFELLIIDDAGSDESIALCRAYDDPRIRIISQSNRGLAGARNTGIRNAKGQFIALLDSDDLWEPQKLERHVEHLRSAPHVGISYAASKLIDDDAQLLRIVQRPKLKNVTPRDVFLRNPIGNDLRRCFAAPSSKTSLTRTKIAKSSTTLMRVSDSRKILNVGAASHLQRVGCLRALAARTRATESMRVGSRRMSCNNSQPGPALKTAWHSLTRTLPRIAALLLKPTNCVTLRAVQSGWVKGHLPGPSSMKPLAPVLGSL